MRRQKKPAFLNSFRNQRAKRKNKLHPHFEITKNKPENIGTRRSAGRKSVCALCSLRRRPRTSPRSIPALELWRDLRPGRFLKQRRFFHRAVPAAHVSFRPQPSLFLCFRVRSGIVRNYRNTIGEFDSPTAKSVSSRWNSPIKIVIVPLGGPVSFRLSSVFRTTRRRRQAQRYLLFFLNVFFIFCRIGYRSRSAIIENNIGLEYGL